MKQLAEMVRQSPPSFASQRDKALRQIERLTEKNKQLQEEIRKKDEQIQELKTENELLKFENKTAKLSLQDCSQVSLHL